MINVFITVDVEIWPERWDRLRQEFGDALSRCIYGPTAKGDFGLPYIFSVLNDHGLTASFFIESLFAREMGNGPLQEIVGRVQENRQEIQLHLHTEWVDKLSQPLLKPCRAGQHMRNFSLEEQTMLIQTALQNLHLAGAENITAFRAGNFGFNIDTLKALAKNNITYDTSYNQCLLGSTSGLSPREILYYPVIAESVVEYPVTIFEDYPGHFRPLQICACSYNEFLHVFRQAELKKWTTIVIVFHSFELLNRKKSSTNPIVVNRFHKICRFLDKHRDRFNTIGFNQISDFSDSEKTKMIRSNPVRTGARYIEQMLGKCFE